MLHLHIYESTCERTAYLVSRAERHDSATASKAKAVDTLHDRLFGDLRSCLVGDREEEEVYLKIPKGINATRINKHNITQCTNMAVDGVVIKCSRICN